MWVYVLALAFVCEAHVRLLHKPYFTLPIRNAASASADGMLSTSGPCGGYIQWGNKSYYSNVTEGQNLTLVFGYNGGHQSPTQNMLRVSMVCGKPQTDLLHRNTTVAKLSSPLVNASQSLTSGYDVWVVIPPIQPGVNGHLCSISVLDVRNWGGCVDVQVLAAGAAPTPAPAAQNALVGANIAGVYDFAQAQCTPDSPGCCCLSGKLTVVHVTGALTASATIMLNSCGNSTVPNSKALDATATIALTQQASTLASLRGAVTIASSMLSIQISAGTTNTLVVTDDSPAPLYCGFESRMANTKPTAPTPGGGVGDNSSASTIGGGIAALMLVVFFSQ